ncbi:RNA polymerase sigma factor [Herbidospora mongoliensis]|uniref:RNA polymerase sigma factor n=1 Tax=Herbidospora mongoliensis TaxID=688067 RepID=UPI000834698F|nr:sigma factor [Herbidospora mongoliensis]
MPEETFTRVFDTCYESVLRYAARRVGKDTAGDIAGETFAVAWRRFGDRPPDDDVLPWLYGIARLLIANEERRERRSGRLIGWEDPSVSQTVVVLGCSPTNRGCVFSARRPTGRAGKGRRSVWMCGYGCPGGWFSSSTRTPGI